MNSNLIVEEMIRRYNFNGYPEEYRVSLVNALDKIRGVFKDNLLSVTLGGSGGKNKIIDGWSDLDIYIILKKYDIKQISLLQEELDDSKIHIGLTFYNLYEIENDLVDFKTKIMVYEKNNYDVNPTLYGMDYFTDSEKMQASAMVAQQHLAKFPDVTQENYDDIIKSISTKENGVKFGAVSKYGFQILPICQSYDVVSDQFVSVNHSSFGATTSTIYDTLSDDYIQSRIEKGYEADLVIFDYSKEFVVKAEDQYSKCGWTPYEGETLRGVIETVFIDGKAVLKDGRI